jgi:hypothetical protein
MTIHLWLTVAAGIVIVLSLVALILHAGIRSIRRTAVLYRSHFSDVRRERLFLASVAFYLTVFTVRLITLAIHFSVGGLHDVSLHGTHVHHLVWGILLLLVVGYIWLAQFGTGGGHGYPWASRVTALLYGIGAALTLDEFALWLNLEDVYWSPEGRESIKAMILFGALLLVGVRGGQFMRALVRDVAGAFRTR